MLKLVFYVRKATKVNSLVNFNSPNIFNQSIKYITKHNTYRQPLANFSAV